MLIIFSHSITQTSPQLEPLVFDAGKELQLRLTRFLNDKVFIEDDDGTDLYMLLLNSLTDVYTLNMLVNE